MNREDEMETSPLSAGQPGPDQTALVHKLGNTGLLIEQQLVFTAHLMEMKHLYTEWWGVSSPTKAPDIVFLLHQFGLQH